MGWRLAHGAAGLVSGHPNFVPELIVSLYRAMTGGDVGEARRLQSQVQVVRKALKDGAHLGLFKWAASWRGLDVGTPRPPLPVAGEKEIVAAERALREIGCFPNSVGLATPSGKSADGY